MRAASKNNLEVLGGSIASQKHKISRSVENVLVLQGGGSLGAFACGVFKALDDSGIKFDIVGGTSIGAVNAAIICGSRSGNPAQDLEDFWLEVAESAYQVIPDIPIAYYDYNTGSAGFRMAPSASLNAIMFGVPKLFVPQWMGTSQTEEIPMEPFLLPAEWTYYYGHSPLAKTLEKYVDFNRLSKNPRLIATAVNVMTAERLVFDSGKMAIKPKHILASTAYSAYGFPWIKLDKNMYAWDGGLLSNTPLQEVVEASPRNDKNVYIVENYPRKINRLPANRAEVIDRTRDIIFSDKTIYDLRIWKHMSRQTEFIEKIYELFERNLDERKLDPSVTKEIRKEYEELVGNYGAEILSIYRIARDRMESPYILKNADFSIRTIRYLIREGETKALAHLKGLTDVEAAEFERSPFM
jgi:NTE family protein